MAPARLAARTDSAKLGFVCAVPANSNIGRSEVHAGLTGEIPDSKVTSFPRTEVNIAVIWCLRFKLVSICWSRLINDVSGEMDFTRLCAIIDPFQLTCPLFQTNVEHFSSIQVDFLANKLANLQ